jgi:large subunit ribosomal protein L22
MPEKRRAKRHALKRDKAIERKKIVRSVLRFQRACPDKVRVVANTIIGKSADEANSILEFGLTKGSRILRRCLSSAVRSAIEAHDFDVESLYVDKVFVDRGPMLKRIHPVSHGMAKHILKRTCHVTVIVDKR